MRCCENPPPRRLWLLVLMKGVRVQIILEMNRYEIQNVKTTGSYNVGDDETVEKQDDTLALRFIEKSNTIQHNTTGILQERK